MIALKTKSNGDLQDLTKEKRLSPFFLLLPSHHPEIEHNIRNIHNNILITKNILPLTKTKKVILKRIVEKEGNANGMLPPITKRIRRHKRQNRHRAPQRTAATSTLYPRQQQRHSLIPNPQRQQRHRLNV